MLIRLGLGLLLIGLAVLLDVFMRLRLENLGQRDVFLRGGTLNYGLYVQEAKRRGWPLWPVYLLIPLILAGTALLAWALFVGAE